MPSTQMSSSGRDSSGKEKVGKKLEDSVGDKLDFSESRIKDCSKDPCSSGWMTCSSYLSGSSGPIRSRQESKVVESGSCCSSSKSTNGVIVNRGAFDEEHTDDDAAKEDTENKDDGGGFEGAFEDSIEVKFVRGVRKQLGSLFSLEEEARKSSECSDKREGAMGRRVCRLGNPAKI